MFRRKWWGGQRSWWTVALGAWLIVMGLVQGLKVEFPYSALVLGGLAIAAGVLLLLGK